MVGSVDTDLADMVVLERMADLVTVGLALGTLVADKVDLGVEDLVDTVDLPTEDFTPVVLLVDKADLGGKDSVDKVDLTLDILVGMDLMDITAVTLITGVFTTGTMKSLKRRKTFFLPLAFSLGLVLGL